MSGRQAGPYDHVARKWLALAERRRASFAELETSGRWRHYYSSAQLDDEIRKADGLCERWAAIAGIAAGYRRPAAVAGISPAVVGLDLGDRAEASHLLMLRQSLGLLSA